MNKLEKEVTRKELPKEGLSRKICLVLQTPDNDDSRPDDVRILQALQKLGIEAAFTVSAMRKLYPLCEESGWKVTVSLAWDGEKWRIVDLESGNTEQMHYGLAVDYGSTSVAMRLIDCAGGNVIAEKSVYNQQIFFGEDILTRIFYAKDNPDHLEEIRRKTVDTFVELLNALTEETGVDCRKALAMTVAGNTTMIHFLLGMDAFCVFHEPYAVHTLAPGFHAGRELSIPITGYVYCFPALANYLGGDIISGVLSTGMYKGEELSLFFDVGTNGELVVGNRDFLICGAGAAGPALEGGSVRTGMRAANGAVDSVRIRDGRFCLHTIGDAAPKGICGSGIVDLLAEMRMHGWIDFLGKLQEEKSNLIGRHAPEDTETEELAVEYADGLYFYQSDIQAFIQTKAAAATMMEIMLLNTGIGMEEVSRFYMAGAFGTHVNKESAVMIGLYPDVEREKIVSAGNTSLAGAQQLLLDRSLLADLDEILGLMSYVQFGAVEDFLIRMQAASALPHTDLDRYPSVQEKLKSLRE